MAFAAAMGLAGCERGSDIAASSRLPLPEPTAVNCAAAPQLRQQAIDERRHSVEEKSDQKKISIGNRAAFVTSLAIVADLTCKVRSAEVAAALTPAVQAARRADAASSFYERTIAWSEANFGATELIARLIQQLPAPPSP
jgi:hypothetical protein